MRAYLAILSSVGMILACASGAFGIDMDWVTVGDPGNLDDSHDIGFGGVDEVYNIGRYEVTNRQYTGFLNAVDPQGQNPNGLYNPKMATSNFAGIRFDAHAPPGAKYLVRTDRENKPVNWVSWYDALRFANWMHNGQGAGGTEDGAYDMSLGANVIRKPGALVFLPSEDEWYKAAYYKGGGTNAGYWDYATQSDSPPVGEAPPGTDMTDGSANYGWCVGDVTDVGAYTTKPSQSAYGTFDQTGNLWEWNETDTVGGGASRGLRGGSFDYDGFWMPAMFRNSNYPTYESLNIGFRVAAIPEPASILLLALAGVAILRKTKP